MDTSRYRHFRVHLAIVIFSSLFILLEVLILLLPWQDIHISFDIQRTLATTITQWRPHLFKLFDIDKAVSSVNSHKNKLNEIPVASPWVLAPFLHWRLKFAGLVLLPVVGFQLVCVLKLCQRTIIIKNIFLGNFKVNYVYNDLRKDRICFLIRSFPNLFSHFILVN